LFTGQLQGKTKHALHNLEQSHHAKVYKVCYVTSGKILLMYVVLNMAGCTPLGTATGAYNHIP